MTEYVRIAVEDIIIKKDNWEQYCKLLEVHKHNLTEKYLHYLQRELIKLEDLRFYEIEECDENGD